MELGKIHLYHLLFWATQPDKERRRDLRALVGTRYRAEIRTAKQGGGDYYNSFRSLMKKHVRGEIDLSEEVEEKCKRNPKIKNGYTKLSNGFNLWWINKRRWHNKPLELLNTPEKKVLDEVGLPVQIKIHDLLLIKDGLGTVRYIYPYMKLQGGLTQEVANTGLWCLHLAFPNVPIQNLRILDVGAGTNWSLSSVDFVNAEKRHLEELTRLICKDWAFEFEDYMKKKSA